MTILENYTEQARDGFVVEPGADPIFGSALALARAADDVFEQVRVGADESDIVPDLGRALRYVANLASQIGLSLEQLAVADIAELEKTQPETYSLAGLGVTE